MNEPDYSTVPATHEEHGTIWSYVIGFVLSLVFTAIPYYLVVNKVYSGSTLLALILGVAFLQMIIQIVFFLHLGRGPKPLYNIVFFGFTVVAIFIVIAGSIWIINHLNYNMMPTEVSKYLAEKEGIHQIGGKETGACDGIGVDHKVTISKDVVSPSHVNAKYCDTIIFINEDDQPREIAFGAHPEHRSYGGEKDLPVRKGRAKTLVLNVAGEHLFHDHFDPKVAGSFTVSQ